MIKKKVAKKKKETQLSVLREIRDFLKGRFPYESVDKRPLEVKSGERFIKLSDGWVKDSQASLEWGPSSSECMIWKQAKTYCEKAGGRLPTVRELESLIDRTKYNPAVNKDAFPDTKSSWYWTNELVAGYSVGAWIVGFYDGDVDNYGMGDRGYVRPVRASQ